MAEPPNADSHAAEATARYTGFYPGTMALPPGISAVEFAALAPLRRGLLVIDGTVTTFLEAVCGEALRIEPLGQQRVALGVTVAGLEASAGIEVLERSVALVGQASGTVHALADSLIVPGRLPAAVRAALEAGTIGIGQALRAPGFATRREGLWFGRGRRPVPPDLAGRLASDFLVRCYRVIAEGQPAMRITEYFPWDLPLP